MHARLTTITGATDIDGGVTFVRDQAVHDLGQQKGFKGITCSADRTTGVMAILSLWETEADLDASESTADKTRGEGLKVIGGHPTVARYEQIAEVVPSTPVEPGSLLRVTPWTCDPAQVDSIRAFFERDVVPALTARNGLRSIRGFVNRQTGAGMIGTVWTDEAAMQGSLDTIKELRAQGTELGMTFGDANLRELLFARMM